jgi:uncharacterized protein (TIGR01777 family)
MPRFVHSSRIPAPAEEVFRWHEREGALERLTPPWERVEVISKDAGLAPGTRVDLRTRIGPLTQRWLAEHVECEAGRRFRDVQVQGPFARWDHTHEITPAGEDACVLEDRIDYELPGGRLGNLVGGAYVRGKLARLFTYRHETLARDIALHGSTAEGSSMKIAVTGTGGLVGNALVPLLSTGGHDVSRLVRRSPQGASEARWDPGTGELDAAALSGVGAVVHLAGENIASRRWSTAQKKRIRDSRVDATRRLCEALARPEILPRTLVCASAVGFYGDRGDEVLDESSPKGTGFLADVCEEWERATEPAREAGIRVVQLRFGMILSPAGGALAKMLLPFKLGAGGVMGSGEQYWSWIAIDDAAGAIVHALGTESLSGPVNAVSPEEATCRTFTRTLGRVLRRPTIVPMPATAARLAFGEMANELLLASARVRPAALESTGYQFRHPELEGALRHLLGR